MMTMTERAPSSVEDQAEHRARHWARRLALQALYQWDMSGDDITGLLKQFSRKEDILKANAQYFEQLVRGVVDHEDDLCEQLVPVLDRPMKRLDPVERTILRFACYELLHCPDVPPAVVLSEATRLAGKFGTDEGRKYVNAVLDKVAASLHKARVDSITGEPDGALHDHPDRESEDG